MSAKKLNSIEKRLGILELAVSELMDIVEELEEKFPTELSIRETGSIAEKVQVLKEAGTIESDEEVIEEDGL